MSVDVRPAGAWRPVPDHRRTRSAHHSAPSGTKIIVADTAFGHSLAVGSGPFKNFTLYYISSDHGHKYGCTTGATSTPIGPLTCTGPSNDKNAEWPAITTNGKPVAGPGVRQALLGRVFRKGVGWVNFPVYTFSGDLGASGITCAEISACARAWPPLYTDGSPGYSGVPAAGVGVTGLPSGLSQITWNGHPLYLFAFEALAPTSTGGGAPAGNGNGIKAFGGTFSLVVNP